MILNKKWTVQFRSVEGCAILTYDDKGRLEAVDISELYHQEEHRDWMWRWFPLKRIDLVDLGRKEKAKITVKAMPEDLSFKRFWNDYDYKIGKKGRTEILWKALSDVDKGKCLAAIPRYKFWLGGKSNMEQLYPQTFLSQRRFDNEFKIK